MDENECLVGELRKYLSTAKYTSQEHESEQVQALKRDLNLAARVGQQLLMQLQSAEKTRSAAEKEVQLLKQKNARLAEENHEMACEHELMVESLSQQEAEINSLMAKLKDAQAKSERLRRATAAAKALEREVGILEHLQMELRQELEQRTQQREDAQKLAKHLASSLAQHVASDFEVLKREVKPIEAPRSDAPRSPIKDGQSFSTTPPQNMSLEMPSLTMDMNSHNTYTASSYDELSTQHQGNMSQASIESLGSQLEHMAIKPRDTATPLKPRPTHRQPAKPLSPRIPPPLMRSRSHESVLSLVPTPTPPVVSTTSKLETTVLPKAVTAVSDECSLAHGHVAEPSVPSRSARDKLSQMRGVPSALPDRKRWAFTPFRGLH